MSISTLPLARARASILADHAANVAQVAPAFVPATVASSQATARVAAASSTPKPFYSVSFEKSEGFTVGALSPYYSIKGWGIDAQTDYATASISTANPKAGDGNQHLRINPSAMWENFSEITVHSPKVKIDSNMAKRVPMSMDLCLAGAGELSIAVYGTITEPSLTPGQVISWFGEIADVEFALNPSSSSGIDPTGIYVNGNVTRSLGTPYSGTYTPLMVAVDFDAQEFQVMYGAQQVYKGHFLSRINPDYGDKVVAVNLVEFIASTGNGHTFTADIDGVMEQRPVTVVDFTWSMQDRTVADANGRILERNSHDYVCPDSFTVNFDARDSRLLSEAPTQYDLTISKDGQPFTTTTSTTGLLSASLPEGNYQVKLVVSNEDGDRVAFVNKSITVEDILVVAMGDSFSSGEGNPEVNRQGAVAAQWMQCGSADAEHNRQNVIAHRSSFAASAQLALDLEKRDPHTSVTFVFVSASGSTIREGGLGAYAGIENAPGYNANNRMAPQIDQIAQITEGRTIDALTISFGANDFGFSRIVKALMLADDAATFQKLQAPLVNAVKRGDQASWEGVNDLVKGVSSIATSTIAGTAGLLTDYGLLRDRIKALQPKNVFMTGYPDLTREMDSRGKPVVSAEIMNDIATGDAGHLWKDLEIDTAELNFLNRYIYPLLQKTLRTVAGKFGWKYVDPYKAFSGHGPGAAAGVRWFVTATESSSQQGPDSRDDTKGTLHPNKVGHREVANLLDKVVFPKFKIKK